MPDEFAPRARRTAAGFSNQERSRSRRAVTRCWRELKVPLEPGDVRAIAPLRYLAGSALTSWGIDHVKVDDVLLVLSELATNALVYTDDTVQVRLFRSAGQIVLDVADTNPVLPDFDSGPGGGADGLRGYGLKLVVTSLADTVTVTPHPCGGKTIAAVFMTGPEEVGSSR